MPADHLEASVPKLPLFFIPRRFRGRVQVLICRHGNLVLVATLRLYEGLRCRLRPAM
jgi:hypothetical protein